MHGLCRCFVYLTAAVPPGSILIDVTDSGSLIAGDKYSLTCNVTKNNPGLTSRPSAQWITSNGGEVMPVADIKVDKLDEALVSSVRLTFPSLRTSLGGNYTCRGVIPTPAVEGGVMASVNSTVIVQSEC